MKVDLNIVLKGDNGKRNGEVYIKVCDFLKELNKTYDLEIETSATFDGGKIDNGFKYTGTGCFLK